MKKERKGNESKDELTKGISQVSSAALEGENFLYRC